MDLESLIVQKITEVKDTVDIDESNLTPIQEFYKDAKIFVTGATGFLGQILVEKLLRTCPVSTIFVLVRNKKGKTAESRLTELFDDAVFKRLRKCHPDFRQKIVIVEGDCFLPNLGINDQDRQMLMDEVNIVFHVAATVRFDEKLKRAAAINVRGSVDLSRIVQKMWKLKSFVHMSTAFSNCINDVIEERVYPPAKSYHQLLQITESLDSVVLDNLTSHFIGKFPNTYSYTKQIAEDAIVQETKGLPVGIYRPSIVVSTLREPVRGWINNFYGVVGVGFGSGIGLLRVLNCDPNGRSHIVPADMCVNGLIASAWDTAERFQRSKVENKQFEVPVYNFDTPNDKNVLWDDIRVMSRKYGRYIPSVKSLWVDMLFLEKSYIIYVIMAFLLHTIPAAIVDTVLFCRGKKMRMLEAYRKIHTFGAVISYFAIKSFNFRVLNVQKMISNMSKRDRELFFCDLRELDWEEFFLTYMPGCRLYLAKDPIETLPQAKIRMNKIFWAHRALLTILGLLAVTTLWYTSSAIYETVIV